MSGVYYENLATEGDGEKDECLDEDEASDVMTLLVVLPDGGTQTYTTTISAIPPTLTPTPTYTFTPEPNPTPTWTPEPPTPSPTPDRVLGVDLAFQGENQVRCSPGQICEVGLLATNSGNTVDTLLVEATEVGALPHQLCNQLGVCSNQQLNVVNVGPSNTAFLTLRIDVPADAVRGQSHSYSFRAISELSEGTVSSPNAPLEVTIE